MSNSPEFNPIPAYEMLKAIHRPDEAQKLYDQMSPEEQRIVTNIMRLLRDRQEQLHDSPLDTAVKRALPRVLSESGLTITPSISECLYCLGYDSQYVSGLFPGGKSEPVTLISW